MKTLIVPFSCEGGADRVGAALGLRRSGSAWIGDCPACGASEALAVRPSRDGRAAHALGVCAGACVDANALRAVLSETLGLGSRVPRKNTRLAPEFLNFGGALPRKRD